MKKTLYTISVIAAAMFAVSCESGITPDGEGTVSESAAVFKPVLSSNAVSVETKASELVSEDGGITIPLSCTVSDGISGNQVLTKGEQKNTTGEVGALENYVTEFYVAGWKGAGTFIPAYQKVVKRDGVFQTATEYSWPAASVATFYGYANLPSTGVSVGATADSQILTYTAVPDNAGDQNDILLGFFRGKGRFDETLLRGGIADMTFFHPLTAVRFKMGTFSGAASVTVKSITMEGVYDSGEATMQPASATATTAPVTWDCSDSGTKTVTLANGDTGWTVTSGNIIGEPFILIPRDFTSSAVKIKVIASLDGGSDVTLTAAIEAVWEAGKTHTYTLGYTLP